MAGPFQPARRLIHLTPILPAPTGNGLAMRQWLFLEAAAIDFEVHVVVAPIMGQGQVSAPRDPGTTIFLPAPNHARLQAEIPALLAHPVWRQRLAQVAPLPRLARMAPPILATDAAAAIPTDKPMGIHVGRSYLAPLGVAISEMVETRWATIDLDDDDEALARSLGDPVAADQYARIIQVFGASFDRVALASSDDAAAVAERHGLATSVIPNAVPAARPGAGGGGATTSVLFVGNLTYQPNVDAAVCLVEEVLPELRSVLRDPVTVTVVGHGDPDLLRRLGGKPGVTAPGYAPDLAPLYHAATVVVAPIRAAAGTRIKLLEAFAYGVPIVASSVAAAGLAVRDGVHLLIADSPRDMAQAVARLRWDRPLADGLVARAGELLANSYSYDAVLPMIREFFAAAATGAQGHSPTG